MPEPVSTTAALITAGASIGGQAGANIANSNLSRRNRHWNQRMVNEQREYDLANWNRVNEYNSPQAQMARFKEAGLNPHLIYGRGSAGLAPAISSPDVKPYNVPQMKSVTQGMNAFGDMYQFRQLQAQTDNIKEQTNVAKQEALLKAAQTAETLIRGHRGKFDLGLAKELRDTSLQSAQVALDNAKASLSQNLDSSVVSRATIQQRIDTATQQLNNLRGTGDLIQLDKHLKLFEKKLNDAGFTKSDDWYMRVGNKIFDDVGQEAQERLSTIGKNFNKFANDLPLPHPTSVVLKFLLKRAISKMKRTNY
jgi:hypothetical protein